MRQPEGNEPLDDEVTREVRVPRLSPRILNDTSRIVVTDVPAAPTPSDPDTSTSRC